MGWCWCGGDTHLAHVLFAMLRHTRAHACFAAREWYVSGNVPVSCCPAGEQTASCCAPPALAPCTAPLAALAGPHCKSG
jgi:hypothetical protein